MSQTNSIQIHESWKTILKEEFEQPYFSVIKQAILKDKQAGKKIFPPGPQIFNAFNSVPFDEVKVVILGQDPYHGPGQAHGLCFSVQDGVAKPPSLENINLLRDEFRLYRFYDWHCKIETTPLAFYRFDPDSAVVAFDNFFNSC